MAVQMTRPIVTLQPVLDKTRAAGGIARLEEAMDPLVRRVDITQVACERALDQLGALRHLPGFDVGPAEVTQKPPIVTPMRRQFFEQRRLRFVMIAAAAEAEQPEHAERQ